MKRLAEKIAIVTGAGQGIGRAAAERFAREGARTIAVDLNRDALRSLEQCEPHVLNVTDAAAVRAFAAGAGAVDILFNCVGVVHNGTILDNDEDDWCRGYEINVGSMFRMIRAVLPGMIQRGGGSIVNMSSVASSIIGVENRCIYAVTKAAVIGLTKSVAVDFVSKGIRCNAICPGTVDTPSLDARLRATGNYESAKAAFIARQPMGRLGKPDEIAELAVYLASDAAAFTTGQIHVIDGGWTM